MKKALLILALASMSAGAFAGNEAYTGVGTTGVNVGYAHDITSSVGARVELNSLDYKRNFSTSDANYDAKLQLQSVGAFADYFPFSNGFRLTGGALIGNNKVTGHATGNSNSTVTINGQQYSSAGESLELSAKFPSVQPYLGIGYGHNTTRKGLGFFADLGVAYGKAKATLTASQGLVAAAGQSNIDAEQRKVQDELDKYKFFPVIRAGISYVF